MKTYRVGPKDFEADKKMTAYEIIFPAYHYMAGDSPFPKTEFWRRPYKPDSRYSEPLDSEVTQEKVEIRYTRVLNGRVSQPNLIWAKPERILLACTHGRDIKKQGKPGRP